MNPVSLYTARQKDLYERARALMAGQIPGWSDDIPSDPAVAVLELASYLSNIQNHKLNRVDDKHYLTYLKLLGAAPQRLAPARFLAGALDRSGLVSGQRFWIDGVPFEAIDSIEDCGGVHHTSLIRNGHPQRFREGESIPIRESGDELHITFTRSLPAGKPARLWLGLLPEPGRVPPDDQTPPPIALSGYLPDGDDWKAIAVQDGTCGLLQSGFLTLTPEKKADSLRICVEGTLEGKPRIYAIALEPVLLEQRHTRSALVELPPPFQLPHGWVGNRSLRFFLPVEEDGWQEASSLFVRDGKVAGWNDAAPRVIRVAASESDFPSEFSLRELAEERIFLDEAGILPDTLRIMVEEGGVWYDCPLREPDPERTLPRGCQWDAGRRELCFGDGRDFRVPRSGRLLVGGCACTRGSAGNGAGGILQGEGVRLISLCPASGGKDAESPKAAFFRAAKEKNEPLRAVTCADYEALARRTPGLALEKVRAMTAKALGNTGAGITLLAKAQSQETLPSLTPWQLRRLQTWLERFRLIGVPLTVRGPRYLPVEVSVSIRVNEPVDGAGIREAALRFTDGVTGPLDFGTELSYTALFAALAAVPGVQLVEALKLRPLSGGVHRTREGGLRLESDMLPYLKDFHLIQI